MSTLTELNPEYDLQNPCWTIWQKEQASKPSHRPEIVTIFIHIVYLFSDLGDINESSCVWPAFCFSFHEKTLQYKHCVKSTPATTEAELLLPKEIVGFSDVCHDLGHPHSDQAQDVGGYGDRTKVTRIKRIATLQ